MWANQNNQFYQQINKSDAIKIVARTSSVVKNLHTCMLVYMFLNFIFILRINKVKKKKKKMIFTLRGSDIFSVT